MTGPTERPLPIADQGIIEKAEATLESVYEARTTLQSDEATAESDLEEAKGVLETAQAGVDDAKKRLVGFHAKDQSVDRDIAKGAFTVAADILADPSLDLVQKTLYALIYSNESLSSSPSDSYKSAAYKARSALDTILELAQPGAPIIEIGSEYHSDHIHVHAGVATAVSVKLTVPRLGTGVYTRLEGGAIDIVLPTASKSTSIDQGLATLDEAAEHRIALINDRWDYGHERLARLAANDEQLVIGNEAISRRLEGLSQGSRIAIILALHAQGVRVQVSEETAVSLQSTLVSAITALANGKEPSDTEYKGAEIGKKPVEFKTHTGYKSVYRKENSLLVVARSLSKHTLSSLLTLAELDKETLLERAAKVLEPLTKEDKRSVGELAQDARTLAGLNTFVDVLYTNEDQELVATTSAS